MGWEHRQLEMVCATCGYEFGEHGDGDAGGADSDMVTWKCPERLNGGGMQGYHPSRHFSHPDLPTAVTTTKVKAKVSYDVSDWQYWQHNRPGECVCGIPKERCDYHR